jgi:hypothetical protein
MRRTYLSDLPKAIITTFIILTSFLLIDCHTQGPIEVDTGNLNEVLSPEGARIVFCRYFRYRYKGFQVTLDPTPYRTAYDSCFVYIIHRETKKLTKILEHGSHHLSWEGDLIAYNQGPGCDVEWVDFEGNLIPPSDIYVMHPDGTGKRFVVKGNSPFILLPDARKLIYRDGRSLFSVNVDGTEKTLIKDLTDLLINEPPRPEGWYAVTWLRDLVWDPNANKILIGIMPPSAPYNGVWEMNLDGSGLRKSRHQYGPYFWTVKDKIPHGEGGIQSVLDALTAGITYEQWGVPAPEDFN